MKITLSYRTVVCLWFLVSMLSGCGSEQQDAEDSGQRVTENPAATNVRSAATDADVATAPVPFPEGFDFPADPAELEQAIRSRDWSSIRRHGWYLWAGINHALADGWPVWHSWPTSSQTFVPDHERIGLAADALAVVGHQMSLIEVNNANSPINLPGPKYPMPDFVKEKWGIDKIRDGEIFQNNGDIMIAGVIYNQAAYSWIRGQGLYLTSTLDKMQNAGTENIQDFPSHSIVLKNMYWPVKGDGLTALPVWDPRPPQEHPKYIGYERWTRAVAIDATRNKVPAGETASVTYLHGVKEHDATTPLGPITFTDAKVVSIENFYHRKIGKDELDAMSPYDRAILDSVAYWCYGREFRPNDYIASIAMHINTKEIPEWALQSVWWHDKPDQGQYAKDRPDIPVSKAPGTWRHYLMVTSYGITAQEDPGQPAQLPIAYNPYIELAANHPIKTNCRNCHTRAAWPRGSHVAKGQPHSSYLAPNGPGPVAVVADDDKIFDGLMRLDFQWSMGDRAIPADKK